MVMVPAKHIDSSLQQGDVQLERYDRVDLRMAENEGEIILPEFRVERHDPATQRIERQEMQHELGTVFEEQGDPMPMAVAGGRIRFDKPRGALGNLAVVPQQAIGNVVP
jgi:hypothetical protein